ncbi:colicin I receptor [Reichenbachiella sp. 5M10]|nr:colicin I receptor [Reichenbachiella sp. 5M10]
MSHSVLRKLGIVAGCLWLILCGGEVVRGQGTIVFGKVKSAGGEALLGVTIIIDHGTTGTISDEDGRFEITNIPAGTHTLTAQFLGFDKQTKTLTLKPSQKTEVNFTLKENTVEMSAIEIEGKSMAREINEQAYSVTAISAKDLLNTTSDAQTMLNRVGGVRVMQDGGLGSTLNFSLNGFSGDQVKFFMDGIPMDNFGSSLSLNNIPVNMIERIEVYKGVVPVWLGTDALGGAVNIITTSKSNYMDMSYTVGSFNTHRLSLNGAYTNKNTGFTVRTNVIGNYSDNNYKVWAQIVENNAIVDTTNVERFHDRYRSGTLRMEAGFVNKPYADQLLIGAILSGNDQQVQTGTTMETVYGKIMRNSRSAIATLKYAKQDLFLKGLDLSLYSAYNRTHSEVIDTLRGYNYNWLGEAIPNPGKLGESSLTQSTLDDQELSSQLNLGYEIGAKQSLALNYSLTHFTRETFDKENPNRIANQFPNTQTKQIVGLAYKIDPTKKWSATVFGKYFFLGVESSKQLDFGLSTQRTEAVESHKKNFGYGIASSYYLLPNLEAKASYEHTYRMPWANEIFGDGLFVQPNPDLGPEQSDNFNFGLGYDFKLREVNRFHLESSLIYRKSKDLIYQVVKGGNPETNYANLSEARNIGIEGGVKYQWKNILNLGASITFQNITDQADSVYNESYTNTGWQKNYQKGFRLPNTPYLFGNAHAGLTFSDWMPSGSSLSINYNFSYVEQYFLDWAELGSKDNKKVIPTQTAHNAEISYGLKEGKYNLTLECRNLANARLYDRYYLQKPGRAFYLKLRFVL